jgi:spore maturation protein A
MNLVWLGLIAFSVVIAVFRQTIPEVSNSIFSSAKTAVELAIGLVGGMTLFLGLMRIAQDAGLIQAVARLFRPLFCWLFPEVPKDHPALGAIAMNMGANMLGLGDAATPMGLKAMQELQTLNTQPDTATHAMSMFLAMNTGSAQLIPVLVLSLRSAAGSRNPGEIIVASIVATLSATIISIGTAKVLSLWWGRKHV